MMSPKKHKPKSAMTSAQMMPLIKQYIQRAVEIEYRQSQQGAMNRVTLQNWLMFVTKLPAAVKQKELAGALSQWASLNEKTWHLAGETAEWAESTSRKIRAMRRDVAICVNKRTHRPKWFTDELVKLRIDMDEIDAAVDEADESDNVDEATAESKPQETEKAACTAQSVNSGMDLAQRGAEKRRSAKTSHSEGPCSKPSGGKFIYKFDEDCQAHSYG